MLHSLLFTYHVIRALGMLRGPAALLMEWARPYYTVHRKHTDGSHGPWLDGFRAWRWTTPRLPDCTVAVRRSLESAFNCLLPVAFPFRPARMRLSRRVSSTSRFVTLWGGRNLIAEQLRLSAAAAADMEQDDIALELAFAALREEHAVMDAFSGEPVS